MSASAAILVLHGPNLNLLGKREPQHYGRRTLEDINRRLEQMARAAGHQVRCHQSNSEHELIELIHDAAEQGVDFIMINPAAFTHTSVALRDALTAVQIPFIEVHLSNIQARETFRQHSYFSALADGLISGFGALGYELAMHAIITKLSENKDK